MEMGPFRSGQPACFLRLGYQKRVHSLIPAGFRAEIRPEALQPFELLDGAAVEAFRLSLIAHAQRPTVRLLGHAVNLADQLYRPASARVPDLPHTKRKVRAFYRQLTLCDACDGQLNRLWDSRSANPAGNYGRGS